ncbi:hypothetical protein NHJ13734_006880 [Beauveria thailandica]
MYKYPTPVFGAASLAAAATTATTAAAGEVAPTLQDHDAQSKVTDTIRGFAFDGESRAPVKELAMKQASILQTSSLQELLYKFALKISNLQKLYQMKKLTMDPYDFYRWAICKNLKTDLHSAVINSRKMLKGIIRTMGDDGGQADQRFRTIVLYWASLTGNEKKFGKNKPCRVRKLGKPSTSKTAKLASYVNREKADVRGRELAHGISHSKERDARRRRLDDREANRPKIYGGVNAHRAERGISK